MVAPNQNIGQIRIPENVVKLSDKNNQQLFAISNAIMPEHDFRYNAFSMISSTISTHCSGRMSYIHSHNTAHM